MNSEILQSTQQTKTIRAWIKKEKDTLTITLRSTEKAKANGIC